MKVRPGLGCEHLDPAAGFHRRADDPERGAVTRSGKAARIAVSQDAGRPPAGGQQAGAERAEAAVRCQILRGDPVRLVLETGDEISPGTGEQRSQSDPHPVESALQVDRGATGVQERRRQVLEAGGGGSAGQVPGEPEDHRVGGGNPDRRSAANDHVADGLPNLAGFGALDPDLFRGEPALVQQSEDPALGVPPERTNHEFTLPAGPRANAGCGTP